MLGGAHSAECLMYSFDFQEIKDLQFKGDWEELTRKMVLQAQKLKAAGAEFIVICTNTMHLMAEDIESGTGLPVVHIAEAAGAEIRKMGLKKVALLGTEFTMQSSFYRDILKDKYEIDLIAIEETDRKIIHDVIYDELVLGIISAESKRKYTEIIEKLAARGAEGVILGCTEIPLLIRQEDVSLPVFDTTAIHSRAAVRYALQ